jgi:uncharacterized ParB-like nuclease family protein
MNLCECAPCPPFVLQLTRVSTDLEASSGAHRMKADDFFPVRNRCCKLRCNHCELQTAKAMLELIGQKTWLERITCCLLRFKTYYRRGYELSPAMIVRSQSLGPDVWYQFARCASYRAYGDRPRTSSRTCASARLTQLLLHEEQVRNTANQYLVRQQRLCQPIWHVSLSQPRSALKPYRTLS